MTKPWKPYFTFKEPTTNAKGSPIIDLKTIFVVISRYGDGDWCNIIKLPASGPTGGGTQHVELDGLQGTYRIDLIAMDSKGVKSKCQKQVLPAVTVDNEPPDGPEFIELATAYPYKV